MKVIMKFGGKSLGEGNRIKNCAELATKNLDDSSTIVVVSAIGETTNHLIELAEQASKGRMEAVQRLLKQIRIMHADAVQSAIKNARTQMATLDQMDRLFLDLEKLSLASCTIKEVTLRTKDMLLSFGERLSSIIMENVINDLGIKSKSFTGGEAGIITDEVFGEATPLMDLTKAKVRSKLSPLLEQRIIPVVAGFIGITQNGETTTLGRGGSDYTATLLAVSLEADEVWLWTDVDGIMTGDPKIIPNARVIPKLSYAEALEMSAFGAKAIHPRALEPVANEKIPVRVKNSLAPNHSGTLITSNEEHKPSEVVKSLALVKDTGMITVSGAGMVGRPGTAARIFEVLTRSGVNILMISQSVSEANISVIVRRSMMHRAVNALEVALLGRGIITEVISEADVNVIAALGAGMKGTRGVAARIFEAVSKKGINIRMIAQGSSELDISFVVQEKDALEALRAIHSEFKLDET
jgi:aspartate kinase